MKRSSFLSIAFTGLLATAAATAQTHEQPEWNDLNISGVNKETACQTAIPFADEGQALRLSIEESPYYQTLNGTWKFHWVADPEKRPKDFFKPDYDVSDWDNIKVPATPGWTLPNSIFSDYIFHILPELGEENIKEMSFDLFAYRQLKDTVSDCEDRYDQIERSLNFPDMPSLYKEKQSREFLNRMEGYLTSLEDELMDFRDVEYKNFTKKEEEMI